MAASALGVESSLAEDFASTLWRARIMILAGALVAAAFAFLSTQRPPSVYEAEALLLHTEADLPPPVQATMILAPPSNQSGLQLAMPTGSTAGPAALDLDTIEYVIKSQSGLSGIVRQLGDEFARTGLTNDALAGRISISEVPRTKLVAVRATMPSEQLAVKTADAVTKTLIEQDQAAIARAAQARLQQIDSQLQALRRDMAGQDNMPPEAKMDGADEARMLRLLYAGLAGRYRQALVESASAFVRLQIVQPPAASEQPSEFPRRRNTVMGFAAGALLAAIVAIGRQYWKPAAGQRAWT